MNLQNWFDSARRHKVRTAIVVGVIAIAFIASHLSGAPTTSSPTPTPAPAKVSAIPKAKTATPVLSPLPTPIPYAGGIPPVLGPRDPSVVQTPSSLAARFALEYYSATLPEAPATIAQRLSGLITPALQTRIANLGSDTESPGSSRAAVTTVGPLTNGQVDVALNWVDLDTSGAVTDNGSAVVRVSVTAQPGGTWLVSDFTIL